MIAEDVVKISNDVCRGKIKDMFRYSLLPCQMEWTDWFPLGNQSIYPSIIKGGTGIYLFGHRKKCFFTPKKKEIYVGQSINIPPRLYKHKSYFIEEVNKTPAKKKIEKGMKSSEKKWTFTDKLVYRDKIINNWEIRCCIINTGNSDLDKFHSKVLEDTLMIQLDLIDNGLNVIEGMST